MRPEAYNPFGHTHQSNYTRTCVHAWLEYYKWSQDLNDINYFDFCFLFSFVVLFFRTFFLHFFLVCIWRLMRNRGVFDCCQEGRMEHTDWSFVCVSSSYRTGKLGTVLVIYAYFVSDCDAWWMGSISHADCHRLDIRHRVCHLTVVRCRFFPRSETDFSRTTNCWKSQNSGISI